MKLVFTVDVDRDVAWAQTAQRAAGSKHSLTPSFDASHRGFVDLLATVNRLRIPTVFFFETATALKMGPVRLGNLHEAGCHGLDHEDFTGAASGHPVPKRARRVILHAAKKSLERKLKKPVLGFRAPYLHADSDLILAIKETGFLYDSSLTVGDPTFLPTDLSELWHSKLSDPRGKPMSGYLWSLMEGRRLESDFHFALKKSRAPYVVLSTHSWHTRQTVSRPLTHQESAQKSRQLRDFLSDLANNHDFVSANEVLALQKKIPR